MTIEMEYRCDCGTWVDMLDCMFSPTKGFVCRACGQKEREGAQLVEATSLALMPRVFQQARPAEAGVPEL